ncbi:hypothetical protein [Sphaerisporangium perillae]|uniref:hypothetical protein n=1 Tax=Sphaerisporangium perillae TaxID=2935860 RepID=UPI00200DF1DE|nr:hypothetical protein [Sphaerisporangium perillae]
MGRLTTCPRCGAAAATPETPSPALQPGSRGLAQHRGGRRARRTVLLVLACASVALAAAWWAFAGRDTPAESSTVNPAGTASAFPGSGSAEAADPGATVDPAATGGPATTSDSATDSTGDTGRAAAQAGTIDRLLSDSGNARAGLGEAIARVSRCERGGAAVIGRITASRREQLAQARALEVDALAGGTELKDALVDALEASLGADAAFGSWASRHVGGGCRATMAKDPDYVRGLARSEDAQAAKLRFVQAWRPVAAMYGLAERKVGEI